MSQILFRLSFRRGLTSALVAACLGLAVFASAPAAAQGRLLDQYVAYLGPDDHYNSRGQRLTQVWQILRQDRANFHRFGIRDQGDEGDGYFASADNRARMESMIRNGRIDAGAARMIVNQQVYVHVEIYSNAVYVTIL